MKKIDFVEKTNKFKYVDVIVFSFFLIFFWFFIDNIFTDIQAHILAIVEINTNDTKHYPPHFLFFFLINFFSGFSNDIPLMNFVTSVLLSIVTTAKYSVSRLIISELNVSTNLKYREEVIVFLSIALLFCFAIPDVYNFFILKKMYLGRVPSVVWHNSTTIFLFPFALLLFWKQFKIMESDDLSFFNRDVLISCLLVIVNISIKPSFLFVFMPISVFFIFKKNKLNNIRESIIQLLPIFIGAIFVIFQYISIYHYQIGSLNKGESSVGFGIPFEFIRSFIPGWYVPIAFILSYAFPIATLLCYKEILKYKPFLYALYLALLGILISAFVIEIGPRKFHGNFTWQNVICVYLLMLTAIAFLLPKLKGKDRYSKKMIFLWSVFILHVLSGFLYLFKMYFTGSYH